MAFIRRALGYPAPPVQLPTPPPTLDQPWRTMAWGAEENLDFILNYKPESEDIKHLRILLYGPVGAGKSSFTNSVSNTILRKNTQLALANAATDKQKSFTKKFTTHQIRKGRSLPKEHYPFVFNDIMGLEADDGVNAEDIKLVLQGHVKEGYMFNPVAPLASDSPHFVASPAADDRVHVLVCVLSANAPDINAAVLKKMAEVREAASNMGIPQVMIVTNIDGACEETEKDLKKVYHSRFLKKKMMDYSGAVGIPMNCVFPVKNYSNEIQVNADVDALILSALRQIISFGDDFLDKM